MRIDYVQMPDLRGKTASEAVGLLCEHCRQTAEQVMRMNSEIEELKRKVQAIEERVG